MPDDEQKNEGLNEQEPVKYDVPNEENMDSEKTDNFEAKEPETPPAGPPAHPELAIIKPPKTVKGRKKKLLVILAVVVVLGALGGGGYWYWQNSKDKPVPAASNTTQTENKPAETKSEIGLNTIAYAFRDGDTKPYELFWRPAASGDKTLAASLPANAYITQHDVSDNKVVFSTELDGDAAIWYSEDGGKKFSKIYEAQNQATEEMGNQITSMVFSSDGSSVVFGLLGADRKNQVIKLDAKSKNTENLFTSDQAGVFIYAYEASQKKIIYSEGCFNCDGNTGSPVILNDMAANTKTNVAAATSTNGIQFADINKDFSEILVKNSTVDQAQANENIGGASFSPPYELVGINLKDSSKKSYGTFGEKPADANAELPFSTAGYMDDGVTPYFALGNQIFSTANGQKSVIYEASKPLLGVYFVGKDNIVASSGGYADFVLNNFSVSGKKSSIILNGDANTIIFGVTRN